jgi:hypothetical protein
VTGLDGRRFGRYRVVGALGKGGMGEVFAATDDLLGREVAIKTLRAGDGPVARLVDERFKHEARAIAQLAHPAIVQVFDVDVAASPPYIVMERVAGPSLAARLEDGALPASEVRALGVQIARALAAAHERGIVHRDVKPANILAAGDGRWKLADFGVAHVPDSSLTLTGQFVGSPAFAAPEALTKGELGPAADVYGLGAVLYQAATGRWPRSEPSSPGIAALLAPPPPVHSLAPGVPPAIARVVERALSVEPGARPTADEVAHALAEDAAVPAVQPTPIPTPVPSSVLPPPPVLAPVAAGAASAWRRRAPWIGAGAALVVGIAIGLSQRGGPTTPAGPAAPAGFAPAFAGDPGSIHVVAPPGLAGKAAKDWDKLVEKLQRGELRPARDKLSEFERKHGRSAESAALAAQLDALDLGAHGPPGPPGPGRDKHRDRDDD